MSQSSIIIVLVLGLSWYSSGQLAKPRVFTAYDCSRPIGNTPVRLRPAELCGTEKATAQRNVKYLLLQKADYVRIPIRKCAMRKTSLAFQCGVYDHQTFSPLHSAFSVPHRVSKTDCDKMWDSMEFRDIKNGPHKLRANSTNIVQYEEKGRTHFDDPTHIRCNGETISWDGKDYHQMMISVQIEIEMTEEEATVDETGEVMVYATQTILPCKSGDGQCIAPSGTYLWEAARPETNCHLYRTREVDGIEVTGDGDSTTFISTDGSMVRLKKLSAHSVCSHLVYSTNYQKLYLTEELGARAFGRPLHPAEMSVTTYANQQDGFLYGQLTNYIQEEFQTIVRRECEQDRSARAAALAWKAAEQEAVADGKTTSLGGAFFATAAGEVWYRYQCLAIEVRPRGTELCYGALPVRLNSADLERYMEVRHTKEQLQARKEEGKVGWSLEEVPQFFLEPHTHRLTIDGIPMPCTSDFTPLYESSNGDWYRAGKDAVPVQTPGFIGDERPETWADHFKVLAELDFEKGGIYTSESVRAMDKFSQAPRASRGLATVLSHQINHGAMDSSYVHASDLFSELPSFQLGFAAVFWKWTERWGHVCGIFLSVICAARLATWTTGVLLRLWTFYNKHGIDWRMVGVLFPSFEEFWLRRLAERQAKQRVEELGLEQETQRPIADDFARLRERLNEIKHEELIVNQQVHNLGRQGGYVRAQAPESDNYLNP